jgi:hypothetical protein
VAIETPPRDLHRLSLEQYHRLIESGGFDEDDLTAPHLGLASISLAELLAVAHR